MTIGFLYFKLIFLDIQFQVIIDEKLVLLI